MDNEEGTRLRNPVESRETEVVAVRDVDAPSLEEYLVNEVDIVQRTFHEAYEYGDLADQIDLRVQLHRGFRCLEFRLRKHRQALVDGGGMDGINDLVKAEAVEIAGVEPQRFSDEHVPKQRNRLARHGARLRRQDWF